MYRHDQSSSGAAGVTSCPGVRFLSPPCLWCCSYGTHRRWSKITACLSPYGPCPSPSLARPVSSHCVSGAFGARDNTAPTARDEEGVCVSVRQLGRVPRLPAVSGGARMCAYVRGVSDVAPPRLPISQAVRRVASLCKNIRKCAKKGWRRGLEGFRGERSAEEGRRGRERED